VAFIFARTADDNLAGLAKKIDELVANNKDKKMAAVLNLIGVDEDAAKKFAAKAGLKNVAVTTVDEKNAKKFSVADSADVTLMYYVKKRVQANASTKKLDEKSAQSIVDTVSKAVQ